MKYCVETKICCIKVPRDCCNPNGNLRCKSFCQITINVIHQVLMQVKVAPTKSDERNAHFFNCRDVRSNSQKSSPLSSSYLKIGTYHPFHDISQQMWTLGVPARWRWQLADTYVKKYSLNMIKMVLAFDFGLHSRRPKTSFVAYFKVL